MLGVSSIYVLLTLFSPTPFMWVWPRLGRGLDTGAEGNEADV